MKKYFKLLMAVPIMAALTVVPVGYPASALDPFKGCSGSSSEVCKGKNDSLMPILENIINTLLFLVGIIAVIVIIVNGIRFVTSNGNSDQVASARNGVIYAVVGIVVAVMAYAIVRFVLNRIV